jgi:hypothetical protein
MKALPVALLSALAFFAQSPAQSQSDEGSAAPAAAHPSGPVIVIDYANPHLSPSHWRLTLHSDGSGQFVSEMGTVNDSPGKLRTPDVSRDVQLTSTFTASVLETAKRHSWFNQDCESHLKVAYQGDKTLSYAGPDGRGSCTYNYSRDREIQTLGDNIGAVAETIIEGVRLEMLLQHDPLGLDKEIQNLVDAAQEGRAQQLCVIRPILERLASDDHVLELVRKRAKSLLARADS